jgi:hypothetical protein
VTTPATVASAGKASAKLVVEAHDVVLAEIAAEKFATRAAFMMGVPSGFAAYFAGEPDGTRTDCPQAAHLVRITLS